MKVTSLRNIGKSTEAKLAQIGITTAEQFLARDPHELYFKLAKKYPGLHPAVLASFIGAHSDTPWYFVYEEAKEEINKVTSSW